jgi:hypothetical protein
MAPDLNVAAAAAESRNTTRQNRNLDTASYATIAGFENSVTFETQRLIPTSEKPPVSFSLSQWNVVSMGTIISCSARYSGTRSFSAPCAAGP